MHQHPAPGHSSLETMTQQDYPPDFRALCAELLEALENAIRIIYNEDGTRHVSSADSVITKADAALAQPESQRPTDEELWELYDQRAGEPDDWPWIRDYARAVLAFCKK